MIHVVGFYLVLSCEAMKHNFVHDRDELSWGGSMPWMDPNHPCYSRCKMNRLCYALERLKACFLILFQFCVGKKVFPAQPSFTNGGGYDNLILPQLRCRSAGFLYYRFRILQLLKQNVPKYRNLETQSGFIFRHPHHHREGQGEDPTALHSAIC